MSNRRTFLQQIPVAAPEIWADDRNHGEWQSPVTRLRGASDGGILAPLPGPDCWPSRPNPKSVTHFSGNLVS